jgi:enoyl-CoA hydratase
MTTGNWLRREDLDDGITRVTLSRAPVNALNPEFLMQFADLLEGLTEDATVKALVLASRFKVFSAGLDLKEAQAFDLADQHAIVTGLNVAFTRLFAFPKPVIAVAEGPAIAGGLFFVLGADWRVAGPGASFGLAEVRVGADFPVGLMEIARATLNPNDLRRLMLGGRPIKAEAALKAGIVDVIAEDAMECALKEAQHFASIPPTTFAAVKHQIRGDVIACIEQAMADGANAPAKGWFNDETKDAMAAMIGSAR